MDLFDVEAIEVAEMQLDLERRAREAGDAARVEVAWAESVRLHHARSKRRTASRGATSTATWSVYTPRSPRSTGLRPRPFSRRERRDAGAG